MSGGTRGQRDGTTGYETPRQPEVAASSLAPSTAVRTASGSQLLDLASPEAEQRLAAALIESNLIHRYVDYAAQAGVPKDSEQSLAENWAQPILAALREQQP